MENSDSSKLDELIGISRSLLNLQRMVLFNMSDTLRRRIIESERGRDPRRLLSYGYRVYSQNEEDGILSEIYERIGFGTRTFLEFGVEAGLENNTCFLLMQGWTGAWIEAGEKHFGAINNSFREHIISGSLKVKNALVSAENINAFISELDIPDLDLLSIDIDGNDYWVWRAIEAANPRVVIIEYNAIFPASYEWIQAYNPNSRYDGTSYHGASLKSFEILGRHKGYSLVGCNINGANAFWVRSDLVWRGGESLFAEPFTAENHYEPFRHPYLKIPTTKRMSARIGQIDHDLERPEQR